ncbi:MAG: sugar phosphate isomerase/epimerase [Cyclobacteriaceae bacterium]|nr:sugar phosphate isomerase/epimerase [Cyclobacteriaceae bacterium]
MSQRRDFLKKSAAIVAGGMLLPQWNAQAEFQKSNALKKLGVGLFSVPRDLEKDFPGTLKKIAQIGFKEIEFYGPYPFSPAEEKERWASVTPSLGFSGSAFYGKSAKEARKILDDNGLTAPSIHCGLPTLKQSMGPLAEAANLIGAKYVILPSAQTQPNLDGYKAQADEFNEIGTQANKYGIRFAYHNHGNGLKPLDGTIPFDLIMERTDPKKVFFQMDIYWVAAAGVNIPALLDKYAGRFKSMHVKDMAKEVRFSGDGGDPGQWMELFPHLANAGSGVMDLKSILSHAVKSGVEHFVVERDIAPNSTEDLKKSYVYLTGLELEK